MTQLSNPNIDTVIFDVGKVLVALDFKLLLGHLARSHQSYTMPEVIAAIDLEAHERGEFTGDVLIDRLHGLSPSVERHEVHQGWLGMFEPIHEMFYLARKLKKQYRVHLLSNVGDLHWAHLNEQYDLIGVAHDVLPSFQAGVIKPDEKIYELAEQRFNLTPQRTVFIDDLLPNVNAAKDRGWYSIQHQAPQQTIQSLRELGVEC
jgi:hypothetical protein